MDQLLIYGANGYTGTLIAEQAVARGGRPTLAGRNPDAVGSLARRLALPHRIFDLRDPAHIDEHLHGIRVVLNCAGPFVRTAMALVEACLRSRVHYLDITGEVDVFESLAERDSDAARAGITLLPGAGFDVVPSDCLAAHLKGRLPAATHLTLGFQGPTRVSRGTARTVVENLHRGGLVRSDGRLTPVSPAFAVRLIDFGRGPTTAVTIPWGDVSTAYYSTAIPNVEVYAAASRGVIRFLRALRSLRWMFRLPPVRGLLNWLVARRPPGPSAEERARGLSLLWGEARDDDSRFVTSRLRGPDGYDITAHAALACAERLLAGGVPAGFQTPSTAFGPDFVLELPGVTREDL